MKILIFGKGYMGGRCAGVWGEDAVLSDVFVNSVEDALEEIRRVQPDAVLNAAGVRGKPNVDWCEDHQRETIRGNTPLPILLAEACQEAGVFFAPHGFRLYFYGDLITKTARGVNTIMAIQFRCTRVASGRRI